jgi:hypothetical protein
MELSENWSTTQMYHSASSSREELRKHERFSLRLPSRISVLDSDDSILELETVDISAAGAFFPTSKPLPKGLKVLVELSLSRESGKGGSSRIKVKGEVLPPRPSGMPVRFESRVEMKPVRARSERPI